MIRCKEIREVMGEGFIIIHRQGHQKMILSKDVFELSYEYDNVDNWIVLRTKYGDYQAPYTG